MTIAAFLGTLYGIENDLKMDTRKNPENLYAVRMMIVRLNKRGLGPIAIKEQTGVSWGAVRKALDLYAGGGAAALRPKVRGRKKGTAKRLTAEQEKDIRNAIRDKRPEQLCVSYAQQHGLDVSIVRPGHIYGPTANESDKRVSSLWPRMAVRGEDIVMKSDGAQLRSYVHCRDCATAILTVLEKGETAKAYNISNRNSVVTIRALAEAICRIAGVKLRISQPSEQEKSLFNPMSNSSLDASSLEQLGWRAQYDIVQGLAETIGALKSHVM